MGLLMIRHGDPFVTAMGQHVSGRTLCPLWGSGGKCPLRSTAHGRGLRPHVDVDGDVDVAVERRLQAMNGSRLMPGDNGILVPGFRRIDTPSAVLSRGIPLFRG